MRWLTKYSKSQKTCIGMEAKYIVILIKIWNSYWNINLSNVAETSCNWLELRLKRAATDLSCSWNELRLTRVAAKLRSDWNELRLTWVVAETSCDWLELGLKWVTTETSYNWNEPQVTVTATSRIDTDYN